MAAARADIARATATAGPSQAVAKPAHKPARVRLMADPQPPSPPVRSLDREPLTVGGRPYPLPALEAAIATARAGYVDIADILANIPARPFNPQTPIATLAELVDHLGADFEEDRVLRYQALGQGDDRQKLARTLKTFQRLLIDMEAFAKLTALSDTGETGDAGYVLVASGDATLAFPLVAALHEGHLALSLTTPFALKPDAPPTLEGVRRQHDQFDPKIDPQHAPMINDVWAFHHLDPRAQLIADAAPRPQALLEAIRLTLATSRSPSRRRPRLRGRMRIRQIRRFAARRAQQHRRAQQPVVAALRLSRGTPHRQNQRQRRRADQPLQTHNAHLQVKPGRAPLLHLPSAQRSRRPQPQQNSLQTHS